MINLSHIKTESHHSTPVLKSTSTSKALKDQDKLSRVIRPNSRFLSRLVGQIEKTNESAQTTVLQRAENVCDNKDVVVAKFKAKSRIKKGNVKNLSADEYRAFQEEGERKIAAIAIEYDLNVTVHCNNAVPRKRAMIRASAAENPHSSDKTCQYRRCEELRRSTSPQKRQRFDNIKLIENNDESQMEKRNIQMGKTSLFSKAFGSLERNNIKR